MKVVVQDTPFDPYAEIAKYQAESVPDGKHGATTTFVGSMRDYNDGFDVSSMYLDHYPGMTEKHIEKVCQEAIDNWKVLDVLVVHRSGKIDVNEPIVLVAVWSAHRADGFDACRYVINYLKESAPFWKREATPEGERWVEHNTEDHGVAARVA
ncbi:MAG: molybdenum cofactor biosynthesis protein MoaE [Gammaproteobacteria bacterium]|nr:MAG: molybdenum cofactor biosynthesis protein MoaE [Gammaproteobacteria bacterium]